ncbi:hypothetical protein BDE36_0318 [Arcticibacter tournemirensis]|nr:hypothetical protein BDE36_0318 [Arcticibacter tournemirensis]
MGCRLTRSIYLHNAPEQLKSEQSLFPPESDKLVCVYGLFFSNKIRKGYIFLVAVFLFPFSGVPLILTRVFLVFYKLAYRPF